MCVQLGCFKNEKVPRLRPVCGVSRKAVNVHCDGHYRAHSSIGRCDFSAEESLRSGAADTGSCLSMPTPVTGKARAKRSRKPQRDGTPYHSAAASAAASSTAAVTTTNIAVTAALEEAEPPDSSVAASDTLLGEGGAAAGGKPGRESRKLKQPNGKVAPARHRLC